MRRVNFHLTEGQVARLKSLSQEKGLKVAELIRRAVDAMLEREDKDRRRKDDPGRRS
jgi:hypothetical protein